MVVAELDRVGTLATLTVDLIGKILVEYADWIVERGEEQSAQDPAFIARGMKVTRDHLVELAKLLTEAVPGERERIGKRPYPSENGTRLTFSDPQYQPGDLTVGNRITPAKLGQSLTDRLVAQEEARPKVWLHSARGAVLTYASDFWQQCVETWQPLRKSECYQGWPLDLPAGQRLSVADDIFDNDRSWLSWGRNAAQFPRLVNGSAVREWIARETERALAGRSRRPVVFISSTSEDLGDYRSRARDAALSADFMPRMMEYFAASGEHPPLEACLAKISGSGGEEPADVLVVIVAHRYGWVPPDQPDSERKSITWLECERAKCEGKEILAFLVDEEQAWPNDLREEERMAQAVKEGNASPELAAEVQDNVKRLGRFRTWLESLGIRRTFTTPESLMAEVLNGLHGWRRRHAERIPNP